MAPTGRGSTAPPADRPTLVAATAARRVPARQRCRRRSLLFTENDTNSERLFGVAERATPYVKDAFHAPSWMATRTP